MHLPNEFLIFYGQRQLWSSLKANERFPQCGTILILHHKIKYLFSFRGAPDGGRLAVVLYVFHFLIIAPTVDFFTPSCLHVVDSVFPAWCRLYYASCCLQTTQTSTEIYSSWFTEGFVFEDLTCLKCEAGWEPHGGNCYYFSTSKSSWTDSRRSCTDLGSDLVKIDSREEDLMENDGEKFWIGLTDSKEEGKWLWVDGSPLNKNFWMPWEPDNQNITDPVGEDCGGMGKKGGADDLICWFDQDFHICLCCIHAVLIT
uniref:C-type lectin domain-containing protein n=1 Tax=Poecilia latipinna TaxID=48699 RepID=A0A3B3UQK5_9TELE